VTVGFGITPLQCQIEMLRLAPTNMHPCRVIILSLLTTLQSIESRTSVSKPAREEKCP